MAHVLLPCDLPSWSEAKSLLRGLQKCTSTLQVARGMEALLDACATCLDPDESKLPDDRLGIRELCRFLEEGLSEGEQRVLLGVVIPCLAEKALLLQRPFEGFNYSLRKEESRFKLDREYCVRLVANAFFSTFPRRTPTSHPTLCDFRFASFFSHLHRRSHRKKLKAFFRFFENLEGEIEGELSITRKTINSSFNSASADKIESSSMPQNQFYSVYCSPHVMGEVLNSSSQKEAKLFFGCPELLSTLCFIEGLEDFESLLVEVTDASAQIICRFCFSDYPRMPTPEALLPLCQDQQSFSSCRTSFSLDSLVKIKNNKQPSIDSQHSSRSSRARTRSGDSAHREDEYVTAEEESDDGGASRASSAGGFVLGGSAHERLGDFRRRIRRRTRRRHHSRRRSCSLGGSSRGGSDMEDISEDPEEPPLPGLVRASSSEPSLTSIPPYQQSGALPLSPAAENAFLRKGARRPMVTSSSGQPKAYSHDGVRPNLPVPFKASFRRQPLQEDESCDSSAMLDSSLLMQGEEDSSSCDSLASSSSSSCSEA